MSVRRFERFACIDWSGQAVARPKGLALAICGDDDAAPELERPEPGWSREGVLDWLLDHAKAQTSLLVGLDLSPALPFVDRDAYFPGLSESPVDARSLWAMVEARCAPELHLAASSFALQTGLSDHFRCQIGPRTLTGASFEPGIGRLRRVEHRQRAMQVNPVSCFNLVGAAQVGKSSLTGMRLLHRLAGRIPVWPFDPLPDRGPVIVEIYTSLAAREAGLPKGRSKIRDAQALDRALDAFTSRPHRPLERYDDHSTDAILTAAWLRRAAHREPLWAPPGLDEVRHTEGWTFGAI